MPWNSTQPEPLPSEALPVARAEISPEERLMLAVLELARSDACSRVEAPAADRLRATARAWFASDDEAWPMSFVAICHQLGVDPEATRAASLAQPAARR